MLFVDQSTSTRQVSLPAELRDSLTNIPERYLSCSGDQLHAFVIHGRTRGKAVRIDLSNLLPPMPHPEGRSRSDYVADSVEYAKKAAEFTGWASEQISTFVAGEHSMPIVDNRTDLLGTLEVASDELANAPPNAEKRIFYLSDMFESMYGAGRRDFDMNPPTSLQVAADWARQDSAAVLTNMRINPDHLRGASVRIYSRPWGNREGSEYVREYWHVMFSLVGIPRERVQFY
ncbi:MAG TPA: hypothetical protein VHG28_10460 [Longimicrobiaceae bacterium]|nr:hypothetical protein [Longimicrobiaceae bacterium]